MFNSNKKKPFITQVMLKAQKAYKKKQGSLASCIMVAFMPERKDTPAIPLSNSPRKTKVQAGGGTIGLTNRHGVVGAAVFWMKRQRILAARGK